MDWNTAHISTQTKENSLVLIFTSTLFWKLINKGQESSLYSVPTTQTITSEQTNRGWREFFFFFFTECSWLITEKVVTEFKYHHFATVREIVDLDDDHQWMLTPQDKRQTHYVPLTKQHSFLHEVFFPLPLRQTDRWNVKSNQTSRSNTDWQKYREERVTWQRAPWGCT